MKTDSRPLVILHQFKSSIDQLRSIMQAPNGVSYHVAIDKEGKIYYITPPNKKALAAKNSSYKGESNLDNVAYHICLVSEDSVYTDLQYMSLGYVIAKTGIVQERIFTHEELDNTGLHKDPENFSFPEMFMAINKFQSNKSIDLGL